MRVWLPDQGWNGRLIGVGNGALGGVISYKQMVPLLMENAVSFSTDTCHLLSKEPNGAVSIAWAKNPEALIDYGYRAIHEAAEGAKAITMLCTASLLNKIISRAALLAAAARPR